MRKVILLLSGPIASGKSTLSKALVQDHGYQSIRSGRYLQSVATYKAISVSRANLQMLGDNLDEETDYAWIVDQVAAPLISANEEHHLWLLDSVRKARQVQHFRSRFSGAVVHAHLTTSETELRRRYELRLAAGGEYEGGTPYDAAVLHPNELASRSLGGIADVVVDTQDAGIALENVLDEIARRSVDSME